MAGPRNDAPKRRIEIKVPDTYRDVNEKVWKELEEYLFTGFLYSPARILGKSFVFKSLNHFELKNINFMRPAAGSAPDIRNVFRAAMIAYSVFMIDGTNVIHNRQEHINGLIRVIMKIPFEIQEKIVENISAINTRSMRLHPLVEPYCHDHRSRFQWMQLRGVPIHSTSATGIAGTEDLGMNYCQQTWVALNGFLDARDRAEREWAHAKFVGSCFNGKGVRQVDEHDKARRNREHQELEERKMSAIREYLNRTEGGSADRTDLILPDGRRATVEGRFRADSAEELADQLSAALSGEKDSHDMIVERHFQRVARERAQQELDQRRIGTPLQQPQGIPVAGAGERTGTRVLPRKDAEAYIQRMKSLAHGGERITPGDRGENFDERRVIGADEIEE